MRFSVLITSALLLCAGCSGGNDETSVENTPVKESVSTTLDVESLMTAISEQSEMVSQACTTASEELATSTRDLSQACEAATAVIDPDKQRYERFLENFIIDPELAIIMAISSDEEGQNTPLTIDPDGAVNSLASTLGHEHRSELKSFARKLLSDPDRLRQYYSLAGESLIKLMVDEIGKANLKRWRADSESVLTLPLDLSFARTYYAAHNCIYDSDATCGSGYPEGEFFSDLSDFKEAFLQHYGIEPNAVAVWTYGFLARRNAEGGPDLVAAWQEILLDFTEQYS